MLLLLAALLLVPAEPPPPRADVRPGERLLAVPYLTGVEIDGNAREWKGVPSHRMAVGANPAVVRFAWDERALYALYEVGDATAVAAASIDEDPELAKKSDSIELFLDAKNEHSRRMDTNDYEVTVARDGRRTTFKGSAALGLSSLETPKDWGMNLPVEAAVVDGPEAGPSGGHGYRVELAIPWAAVGTTPSADRPFGLDAAVNDVYRVSQATFASRSADLFGHEHFESPQLWGYARLRPAAASARWGRFLLPAAVLAALLGASAWLWIRRRRAPARRPVARAPGVVSSASMPADEDPVERLRRGLAPQLREDLTADTLAEIAGVSLRTLQRIFRERFDTTPMNWLIDARLDEAARLIREGDDPVTKIAYRVGFKDPSHFTRRFKARFGCSPNEYRRQSTGSSGPRQAVE